MYEVTIYLVIFVISVLLYSTKTNPAKILAIYSQPGKWYYLKYSVILTFLWVRKLFYMISSTVPVENLEQLKPLSRDAEGFDAVYFQAIQKIGFYICLGIERRHQAKAHVVLYVAVPKLGLLESQHLPNSTMVVDPETVLNLKTYSAGGLTITPIEPMKKWSIHYEGVMKHYKTAELVPVKIHGEWTSKVPYFSFETDLNLKAVARAIAREPWSMIFFTSLKEFHQNHYEQMGSFPCQLGIYKRKYEFNFDSFRSHSFGYKRDYSVMHRYVNHVLYLDDGTRISIGIVSQPCTLSLVETGYIILPDKSIHTVDHCDMLLYQHGEDGKPGKNYAFSFTANDETYEVKIQVKYESVHYKGHETEAKILERFIKCEVNGISGRGISEWHYNNISTKREIY